MLALSLIIAVVVLIAFNLEASEFRTRGMVTAVGTVLFVVLGCAVMFSFVVFAQGLLLGVLVLLPKKQPWSLATMLRASVVASLVPFLLIGVLHLFERPRFATMRAEFPLESLDDRFPNPPPPVTLFNNPYLASMEEQVRQHDRRNFRSEMLRELHEDQIKLFVTHPGFGVTRMYPMRPESRWLQNERPRLEQIEPASPLSANTEYVVGSLRPLADDAAHINNVLDFVNFDGLGYFRDRRHVAGFQGHRFTEGPRMNVARVELVGLLLHPQPVVYVSDNLPSMDELRKAPTRPLDAFERAALKEVQAGQELLQATTPDGERLFGSIRSVAQCAKCHETERGALLGAFSYTLKKAGK